MTYVRICRDAERNQNRFIAIYTPHADGYTETEWYIIYTYYYHYYTDTRHNDAGTHKIYNIIVMRATTHNTIIHLYDIGHRYIIL